MSHVDFERAVLGAILLNSRTYEQAAELRPDDFSLDSHRRIFARMIDLDGTGSPIDILTLREALSSHGELELIGGEPYISSLIDGLPERPSIQHYVQKLRQAAERRRAAKSLEKAQRIVEDPSVPLAALTEIGHDLTTLAAGNKSLPPRFSEEALALRFSRQYAKDLLYVSRWGQWMRWDGKRWREDDTLAVFNQCRAICRHASAECGDAKERAAMKIATAQTVAAIERLARADLRHAATVDQWDADPWLLNTPGGTIDLRTGTLNEHRSEQYLTKMAAAPPGEGCPLWRRFLDCVTDGNSELQMFLQRVTGYCLTGSTREHALFFLYGTGANGKSVFLSTIAGLLADYAKSAPASAFTASNSEQHPTDVAGLRGARFVTATETEDGRWWAEAKIKNLTGGDRVTARFMRQDFFEYLPQFKLVVAGNHKPGLRSVDEAIRRRLHLIPFTVTVSEQQRDPDLAEKLKAEYPGILQWAVEGCLMWQREGLKPPAEVRDATDQYLAAEDAIGRWLEDCCAIDPICWTAAGILFANYQAWCEQTGERESSQKRFTQQLETHGFERQRTNRAKGFIGIALRGDVVPDVPGSPISPVSRTHADVPNG